MRRSRLFVPTLREDPAEAEIASHRLLLRAGFIRQLAAGIYTSLPLGLRAMRKIEAIVREEMDGSGAQEIRMPIVLPAEPWRRTGRYELYGEVLFRLRDRHGRDLLLGPTQEEVVTPLVAGDRPPYRDLPVNLYQVEWKYRDEYRPRFGLLRVREFLMKDAYSFDRDEQAMARSYETMFQAYRRIFDRCGMDYVIVDAEPGQIGGGVNHEFMARAEVGEDLFVECEHGDYLADLKAATPMAPPPAEPGRAPLEVVDTPGAATIEAVSTLLGRPASQMLKTMLYDAGGRTVAVLLPGDREVEEAKVERSFFPTPIRRFEDGDFSARGYEKGFVGPQGLPEDVTIVADPSVLRAGDWVTGANEDDRHVTGANSPRDFRIDRVEDVVVLRDGDRCPVDGGELRVGRGIVIGHIYQLGSKYSAPLQARFVDEDGAERPYQVVVIAATMDHERSVAEAGRIHDELEARGTEVLLDERPETAGVKFADADLIGFPVQVVVGKRGVENGSVDLKLRRTGERSSAALDRAPDATLELLERAP